MALDIIQIPALSDNYIYLLHDRAMQSIAVVDPSEAAPVIAALDARGWRLDSILTTHHHMDHVGGNRELQARYGCPVYGYGPDAARIPGITHPVREGDTVTVGGAEATVLFTPAHTSGHIAYHFAADKALFCGDTLFTMGCGRLFEGTAAQMFESLGKLSRLPADMQVYCAHEYTQSNGNFALTVEPHNAALQARMEQVRAARQRGEPTVPATLELERATNPFLRTHSPGIRQELGMMDAADVDVFAELRRRKDNF